MMVGKRFDPRARIALWLAILIASVVLPTGSHLWIGLILVGIGAILTGAGRTWLGFGLKLVLPTAVMLMIVYGLLVPPPEGEQRTLVLGLAVWLPGLLVAAEKTARLLMIGGGTLAFITVTSRTELAEGMRRLGIPSPLVMMAVSSFSMFPLVVQRIRQIADAQRSRGLVPRGLFIGRLRVYLPILGPLLFSLIGDSLERSALWESRGYLVRKLDRRVMNPIDWGIMLLAVAWLSWGGVARWMS